MTSGILRWLAAAGLVVAAAGCGDSDTTTLTPDAATDTTPDVAGDAAGSDTGADTAGDSLTGQTDVAGPDASTDCATPCVDGDGNPCTVVLCEAGSCVTRTLPDGTACEDGNPCVGGDTCKAGTCAAGSVDSGDCGCETEADCAGLNDALTCNGSYFCDKSQFPFTCQINPASIPPCEAQTPPSPCVVAACVEPGVAGGKPQCAWQTVADGTACDDANPLTSGDVCVKGACLPGEFVGECQANADCVAFEDSNLCNGQLFCNKAKGQCQVNPATIVVCPTSNDTTCSRNTCQPASGQCVQTASNEGLSCEDGESCTTDETCKAGSCVAGGNSCSCASDLDCVAQEDGNLCNGTLFCNLQLGQCQLNPATVVSCGESTEPCQQLVCVPQTGACVATAAEDGEPCNADNNLCTPQDSCVSGSCKAGANLCTCASNADCGVFEDGDLCNGQLYCNLQVGGCELNPATVVSCAVSAPGDCTAQVCVPLSGECTAVVANEGGGCDDGDPCTLGDQCAAGACISGNSACSCVTDTDCAGEEDGNFCNGTLFCDKISGTCKLNPASVVLCADATPTDCAIPTCQPATGLCEDATQSAGVPCDDGDACTAGTLCNNAGECTGGLESCGCASDLDCLAEDDGNACNGVVKCDLSIFPVPQCKLVPPAPCEDGPCLIASCKPETGACVLVPQLNLGPCDDGDACTTDTSCGILGCTGAALDCDDSEPCTLDWCWQGVCQHAALPEKVACEDGDPCTVVDYCEGGSCKHINKFCDDGNVCTDDGCTDGNCSYVDSTSSCDDGKDCTVDDVCTMGLCLGAPFVCPDNGPCLVASCVEATCVYQPGNNGATCTDDLPCTVLAACSGGVCKRTETLVCDDGNPCTTDASCEDGMEGGCVVQEQPDGNPSVYWSTLMPNDSAWWGSLTAHAKSGRIAALGGGSNNDPLLRVWPPNGGTPSDYELSYPGTNQANFLLDDGASGWLISGYNGGQYSTTQTTKPLLMRANYMGQLQWVSTNLAPNLSLGQMVHLPKEEVAGADRLMVAGAYAPSGNANLMQMWIGEVDFGGVAGPVLIRSATCSISASGSFELGLHGDRLTRLSDGSWVVAGWLTTTSMQMTTESAAFCRFDADLKPIGEPVIAGNNGRTQSVHARPDGGFWWLDDAERWRVVDAAGSVLLNQHLGGWASAVVPDGDGAWLGYNNDGSWSVAYKPLTGDGQLSFDVLSGADGSIYGIAKTATGFAVLYAQNNDTVLQHLDARMYATCTEAKDCSDPCDGLPPQSLGRCAEGICNGGPLTCDDNNPCTLDSTMQTGCTYAASEAISCDDGDDCTPLAQDVCSNGKCVGSSRYGQSSWTVDAGERILDGVPYGDGFLVVGTRLQDSQIKGFWRLYKADRSFDDEGEVASGVPLRLARSSAALNATGSFAFGDWVGLVTEGTAFDVSLWFLHPVSGQIVGGTVYTTSQKLLAVVQTDTETLQLLRRSTNGVTWNKFTPGGGVESVYVWNVYDTVLDGHLLPVDNDWVVAITVSGGGGASLRIQALTSTGSPLGTSTFDPLYAPGAIDSKLCPYAARARQGVQVVCHSGQAYFFDPGDGGVVTQMPETLATLLETPAAPLVATRYGALHSLFFRESTGQWTVYPHDGFFNAATQRVAQVASTAPVFVSSPDGVWMVTETIVGTSREVSLLHIDPWGNISCTASGGCATASCEDNFECTQDSCSAGQCTHSPIDPSGNCGPTGPCGTCTSN